MRNEREVLTYSSLATAVLGVVLLGIDGSLGLGFLFGGCMGTIVFWFLIVDLTSLLRDGRQIERRARRGYLKRYVLYGATLAISLSQPLFSFPATMVGLLIPKLMILLLAAARR